MLRFPFVFPGPARGSMYTILFPVLDSATVFYTPLMVLRN